MRRLQILRLEENDLKLTLRIVGGFFFLSKLDVKFSVREKTVLNTECEDDVRQQREESKKKKRKRREETRQQPRKATRAK